MTHKGKLYPRVHDISPGSWYVLDCGVVSSRDGPASFLLPVYERSSSNLYELQFLEIQLTQDTDENLRELLLMDLLDAGAAHKKTIQF